MEKADLEGELIYQEDKVRVNTFPNDPEAHNVWIGDNYFLFPRGVLQQYAEKSWPQYMRENLNAFNRNITLVLDQERISPEGFALILARARLKEQAGFAEFMYQEGKRARD